MKAYKVRTSSSSSKGTCAATSNSSVFLYTPNIFTLSISLETLTHNIHSFLSSNLYMAQSFNVNYTPDNNYMTHPDGSMTRDNMDLTFTELEPIYQGDQLPEEGDSTWVTKMGKKAF